MQASLRRRRMSSFAARTTHSTSASTSASTKPWTARSTASRSSAARTRLPRAAASSSSSAAHDLCALEREWRSAGYDLNARWALMKRLWTLETSRAVLSLDEWNLGWHSAKSYVGITYMYDDRGDIFVSKYLCLDPEFDNAIGCYAMNSRTRWPDRRARIMGLDFARRARRWMCPPRGVRRRRGHSIPDQRCR